jgi:hypothetical protein
VKERRWRPLAGPLLFGCCLRSFDAAKAGASDRPSGRLGGRFALIAGSRDCSASLAPRIPDMPSGMDQRMTALERAFQLARSGRVTGLAEIVAALKRDGYSASQIEGPLLKRQLAYLIKAARKGRKSCFVTTT